MMNEKIKADLEERGRASLAKERKILGYLEASPKQIFTLREICNKNGVHSGSFWAVAYHLASQGKIGFADRKYHMFGGDLSGYGQRIRCVVWHRDHKPKGITIKPRWATHEAPQEEPQPVQPSLFGNIEDLTSVELENLIKRAQSLKIIRALEERYKGADEQITQKVKAALRGVGVADPVAYVHADDDCTFLTMTTTKAMPIKITLGTKEGSQTIEAAHLTIHGAPCVWTILEAYKARGAQ
jgi:hypothetical protein